MSIKNIEILEQHIASLENLEFFLFLEGIDKGNLATKDILALKKKLNRIKLNATNFIYCKLKKGKMPQKKAKRAKDGKNTNR
jgi:hypothetical protein